MAHYAFIDENNTVIQVIVGIDENELINGISPEQWYGDFTGQQCIRTSYNGKIRKQYAAIGGSYDPEADVFISPKPFPSWVLDENHDWQPPTPQPDGDYFWDEESLSWQPIV